MSVCARRETDHTPLTVEIGLEPRIVGKQELADRTGGDNLFMPKHRDPVADRKQAVEIVRDHEHSEAERLLQRADEIVEIAGGNRVEARGRLVEEHDLRIERERPRQRDALGHAAGQLGRQFVGSFRRQADERQLLQRESVERRLGQAQMLAHRRLDVLPHGQAREQRALLEQHAPALADHETLVRRHLVDVQAEHFDRARLFVQQAEDRARQDRLAGARGADKAQHLAAIEIEIEPVHHQMVAEADFEAAHANDDFALGRRRRRRGGLVVQ